MGIKVIENKSLNIEAWVNSKKSTVGSSEIGIVTGKSPYSSSLELYLEKTSDSVAPVNNDAVFWGTRLEPIILERFSQVQGVEVTPCDDVYSMSEHQSLRASPDGFFEKDGEGQIVEVKTYGIYSEKNWEKEVPPHYIEQLNWQLGVLGLKKGVIAALRLADRKLIIHEHIFNEEDFQKAVQMALFFLRCVKNKTPHLIIDRFSSLPDPVVEEDKIILTGYEETIEEIERLTEAYDDINGQLRILKAEIDARKEGLLALLQGKRGICGRYDLIVNTTVVKERVTKGYSYTKLKIVSKG